MPKPKKSSVPMRRETPRPHVPHSELPAMHAMSREQIIRLNGVKEAAISELQTEYGGSMRHLGIEKLIENYYFPELMRGMTAYLEARARKSVGVRPAQGDEIYLSEEFDEHMRNWQNAIAVNYRGKDKESVDGFFREFYAHFHAKLRSQSGKLGSSHLLSE